jgi:transposase
MKIEPINLRARIERVRLRFDTRLAEALLERPDLSQAEIGKQFGISQNVIRRVIKQFNISARKRGPKRGPQPANPVLNV